VRVTPLLIIEAVLAALLAACCIYTWSSGSHQREVASTWREARDKLVNDEPRAAIEPLEHFLELCPDHPDVRLQLAELYLGEDQLPKARAQYQKVAKDKFPKFPGEEKELKQLRALAEVALGMMDGAAGVKSKDPVKRKDKFASAKAHFEAAINIEHPEGLSPKPGEAGKSEEEDGKPPRAKLAAFGDACAGLGLLALWAGDFDEADKRFKQALSDKTVLSKEVLPELYNAIGVLQPAQGRPTRAARYFGIAKVYRPKDRKGKKWTVPDRNRQIIMRGMTDAPEMKADLRRKLLSQLVRGLKSTRNPSYDTYNLLGCGYYRLKDIPNALKYLELAVKKDPERSAAQFNLLAVRWEICEAKRAAFRKKHSELFPPLPGTPQQRRWQTPLGKQGGPKHSKDALAFYHKARSDFRKAQMAFDAASARALAKVQKLPPGLELELVLIRLEMLPDIGGWLVRYGNAAGKLQGKKRLAGVDPLLAEALKKFPKDHRLHRLQGIRRLTAGDVKGALAAFDRSIALEADQPDVKAVQAVFAPKIEVVGFRPAAAPGVKGSSALARSSRPLVGVLFRAYTGPVPLDGEKVKLKLDGREVAGYFWGSEFLHLPQKELADGAHTLEAQAEDLLGRKASAKFEFHVDGSRPEIHKTEPPDGGKIKAGRPRLVIHYRDTYSGIDPASVEIELSTVRATTWIRENPVMGGRYHYSYAALGIKKGVQVGDDKVVFSSSRSLGPGTYRVKISVQDARGLKTEETWTFVVVK